LDDGVDDTFVSGGQEEVSFALIDFNGQYHRPIAWPIWFWLNGESFMPPGGLCHPSDDLGSKF
jgi:hypothetical protein